MLQAEIKQRLTTLRRAEYLRRRRRKKEQARTCFFRDPFRFLKNLFSKEKNGELSSSKEAVEAHLKEVHTDFHRADPIVLPPDMPPLPSPQHQLDTSPP